MNLYLDIETVPAQDPAIIAALRADADAELEESLAAVRAPANYKDEAKIVAFAEDAKAKLRADHEASVEAAYRKTALDGAAGELCVIGYAVDDDVLLAGYVDPPELNERDLLLSFFDSISFLYTISHKPVLVGHNVIEFDLRFIWQRAIVHGIRPPPGFPREPKPWDGTVYDTMLQWAGVRGKISQDRLCRALGLPGKPMVDGKPMDGSRVWDLVKAGRIAEVAKYCKNDVSRVRDIHRRMTFA